jgi:hypothetical protein
VNPPRWQLVRNRREERKVGAVAPFHARLGRALANGTTGGAVVLSLLRRSLAHRNSVTDLTYSVKPYAVREILLALLNANDLFDPLI